MYPADGLGAEGGYVSSDLPTSVTLVIEDTNIVLELKGVESGYPYYDMEGEPWWWIDWSVFGWFLRRNTECSYLMGCLIGDYVLGGGGCDPETNPEQNGCLEPCPNPVTVEDQFAAEYVFTGIGGEPDVTVSRVSLCVWSGVDSCGNTWYLTYGVSGPIESGLEYGWNAKPWSQFDCNFTEPFSSSKTGDQNTPVGSYDGTASVTVSEVP